MEYYTSVYYTFSTIAQVLAGFIAISGVFVLFKIQDLRKIQLVQAQQFYSYMSGSGLPENSFHRCPTIAVKLKNLRLAESTAGMAEEIKYILNDEQVKKIHQYVRLQKWGGIIEKTAFKKNTVQKLTTISIIIGAFTIISSLIILSLTPTIKQQFFPLIKSIGLFLASLSIIVMVCSILISIRDTEISEIE